MTHFTKNGNSFNVSATGAVDLYDMLPPGNYVLQKSMFGLYLDKIGDFTTPPKMYGDCVQNTKRIIGTFLDRPATTGVMLTGEKGSGKTLLSKNVCIELAKLDIPTIVINAPFSGDAFNSFIQSIDQPCAILFDEFEKVYDREGQEQILTLLDGVFPSKKLFLMTCNDKWRVDQHMRNRPGRIYYMLDFKGLEPTFISEYCRDNLKDTSQIDRIVSISGLFAEFNFDMLKALIEEMNRYGESPQEALRMLNAKPEFDGGTSYDVKIVHQGIEIENFNPERFEGNPLAKNGVNVNFDTGATDEDGDTEYKYVAFTCDTLVKVDASTGVFVFKDRDSDTTVTLSKIKRPAFNYDSF